MKIMKVRAREVLGSRGNPTVEAEVVINDTFFGRAIPPSGASTGEKEAAELGDGDAKRYKGKGVSKAVEHVNKILADALLGKEFLKQKDVDEIIILMIHTS